MEILSSKFSISPESFAEHLMNSGTRDDRDPDSWHTHSMKKSYMSIKWCRLTKRRMQRPSSVKDYAEFLRPTRRHKPNGLSWNEDVSVADTRGYSYLHESQVVRHEIKPMRNIIKCGWDLNTFAARDPPVSSLVAWEERATVWSKQTDGCLVSELPPFAFICLPK